MNDRSKAARGARGAAAVTTLLQSVCNRLPVGFALFDADFALAVWNTRFAELGGYPRKLVKAGTPLESFVRFDAEGGGYGAGAIEPLVRQRLAALKRGPRTEREQSLPDGRILRIASEVAPGAGVLLTYEDVTDNRGNEERLRESAARYELALRGISEGFYDWDIANGTIYYSERVRDAVGFSPRELRTPGDWRARIHPDDLARYDATHVAHFKGETERFECDYRYRGRDGSWRWARQHGVALRDERGRAYRMVGSTGDITGLKRAEEALRASEERHALAMRAAVEGIYEWNVETDALFLSDHAKAFFAFPAERLSPKDWKARVHPEDFEAYRHATVNHLKGRTPQLELEYRVRDAAGGYRWVLDRGVGVRNAQGRVTKLVGALSDVTQRKLAEIELRRARDETKEALAQQTALREVLEAISRSAFDLDTVLRTLIEHATRLVGAEKGFIFRLEGDTYRLAVDFGTSAEFREFIARNVIRAESPGLVGLTVREGRTVHIEDALADPRFGWHESQRLGGFRTMLGVPMLRDGAVIGVIALWKERVEPFTPAQVELVTAFSNQALIAIENARLFNETKEALEQQTATAEILRVISSSPTEIQPVLDAVAESAARVCGATDAVITRIEGEALRWVAHYGPIPSMIEAEEPRPLRPLSRGAVSGRAVLDRKTVHLADLAAEPDAEFPLGKELQRRFGYRTVLATPLLREGIPIGTIGIRRMEVRPFSDTQIKLLETFASQAVIAIENVRLFNETKEALDQQRASAEVLSAISSSIADARPVFDKILERCQALFGGRLVGINLVGDDGRLGLTAYQGPGREELERVFPLAIDHESGSGRSIVERRVIHYPDAQHGADVPAATRRGCTATGIKSVIFAPMLWEERGIGTIFLGREHVGSFSEKEIALLKTFADQAVIAIQNARLFNETKEALERQTATAAILRAISGSLTDVAPVFAAILENAMRLCDGNTAALWQYDGQALRFAAGRGISAEAEALFREHALEPGAYNPTPQAALERRPVHVLDVFAVPGYRPLIPSGTLPHRPNAATVLAVPLLRDGELLGVISVWRFEKRLFAEKQVEMVNTFAAQAVIAIENVRLFNETKEALERQTATAEILKVIASSPGDEQPVFDAIITHAGRIAGGCSVNVSRMVGDKLHLAAYTRISPEADKLLESAFPVSPMEIGRPIAEAVRQKAPRLVSDFETDPDVGPKAREVMRARGFRSTLYVPIVRRTAYDEDVVHGVMHVSKVEPGPFPEHWVSILRTFADQAVIAIENVRLFNETKEALDQQTATAEILRVMSSSPTDVQPVFEAIVQSGIRLFENAAVAVVRPEGGQVRLMAIAERDPQRAEMWRGRFPFPLTREYMHGAAILDCKTVDVPDVLALADRFQAGKQNFLASGYRAMTVAPMVRDGVAIGTISVIRMSPGPLSEKQLGLLKTFADQAVIAIENVRLFNETKEALERQTATAEILKVISSSPTDVQPVFEEILRAAARLCDSSLAAIFRFDGKLLHLAANHNWSADALARVRGEYPMAPKPDRISGRIILSRQVVRIDDTLADPAYHQPTAKAGGWRRMLGVPMLREGAPIGAIVVAWREPGTTPERQVDLLQTFADQAALAIENVRLFNETKEALDQQKASAEVLQVISSSVADARPVFDKILESCHRLLETRNVGIALVGDDGVAHLAAYKGANREQVERHYPLPLTRDSGAGEAILKRGVAHYPDVAGADVPEYARRGASIAGFKSLAVAPMLWEGRGIGTIFVGREHPGAFSEKEIALLKTFADQAVIAIQNARLFREIEEKSHQLEIADQHKSAFLANMSHELRTPLNAVIGFSEMLTARYFGDLTAKQAEYVGDIHASGKHLLSLINDILDLSKIEAGRTELELAEFDLPAALDNALTLVRERAQRGGVALRLEAEPQLRAFHADERKLKQVMLNLLSNAVKFTPGGGSVTVVAKQVDGHAEIAVSDTGVGIAPEDQEAIFEAFRQVGTDVTRKREGTGLGLALARRFVELHGGTIRVASAPGKGSTFTVTLPIRHGE